MGDRDVCRGIEEQSLGKHTQTDTSLLAPVGYVHSGTKRGSHSCPPVGIACHSLVVPRQADRG